MDEEEDIALKRDPPAWQDSDDERLKISLMAIPRLRKLRQYEGEDVISGRDYVRRLRKQYVSSVRFVEKKNIAETI